VKPKNVPAGSTRARWEKELRASIAQIDEKGLRFLLRQAQALIHNARVEQMQTSSEEAADEPSRPAGESARETVSIEKAAGGGPIFLTIGRARKVMAPEEMKRLVRVCYAAETRSEALRQLFTVLVRERRDILTDAMIGGPDNPLILALFNAVRETYRLEDR